MKIRTATSKNEDVIAGKYPRNITDTEPLLL